MCVCRLLVSGDLFGCDGHSTHQHKQQTHKCCNIYFRWFDHWSRRVRSLSVSVEMSSRDDDDDTITSQNAVEPIYEDYQLREKEPAKINRIWTCKSKTLFFFFPAYKFNLWHLFVCLSFEILTASVTFLAHNVRKSSTRCASCLFSERIESDKNTWKLERAVHVL